jgi:DNA-binding response OmpR family regulator
MMSRSEVAPKIIIVDDDREMRELLGSALEQEGFTVSQVANGLRLISTLHVDKPDLVVLDVNMSWIDGFELCRSLRSNPELQHIPVVFVTGRAGDADRRRGLEVGAQAYFTKPINLTAFVAKLRELVARSAASNAPAGG